jgi:ubiquitin carboxyl-terminal hydrolase 16/45
MYRLYALVVHLGSMVGGHYIAYVLVDPGKMFGDPSAIQVESEQVTENMSNLALDQSAGGGHKSMPASASNSAQTSPNASRTSVPKAGQPAGKKDKRVWCYCSE